MNSALILFILVLFPLSASSASLQQAEAIEKHPEWDQGYSKKIREYTTGPQFMTDLVDHLPASDKVPTPEKFLGYVMGSPDHLTYAEDVHKYMRELEKASPRVKVFTIGKSEEDREMILVAIADEETMENLHEYKEMNEKLSDPRKLSDDEAMRLVKQGKPMYYATGAMHSPETGSPEMLMELAYRLAVEETPMIQNIRRNIITLLTPVLEVDGRNRFVDLVRWHEANPGAGVPPLMYWGHYVAHDNNRDYTGLALNLTRNVLKTFFDWHPQVIHDLHESIPFLYISTGTGPYNAWLDPIAIEEWQRMAYHEVQVLTEKGLPGVWTHGFFDGWATSYMFWIAHGHNAIGRFYETYGNLVPSTQDRVVRDNSKRAWYRLNPPLPQVKWSLRNNVNYQQSGLLLALDYMAQNREHFLKNYWKIGKRSIAKATTEGPAAYVFEANQKRTGQLRDLLHLLQAHGIEIQQAEKPFSLKLMWPPKMKEQENRKKEEAAENENSGKKEEKKAEGPVKFSAGSFIVRMDQPYSRLADAFLDTQYVRGDERVYDDTGWTLGYLRNVEFKRIVNQEVLQIPMHPWDGTIPVSRPAFKSGVVAIQNHADTDLVRLRYALPDAKFSITEEEWKKRDKTWPGGTVLISLDGSNSSQVEEALRATNLQYETLEAGPLVKTHPLPAARIAILHTWLGTQDEGWYRLALESLKVPYQYISTQDVSTDSNLFNKFDVIVFPPSDGHLPQDIVNGMPAGPPLPWKKTELTPNLGVDETDDMRPGLGLNGVANLKKFVEEGGLLITVRDTAEWAIHYGLARWVKVVPATKLKAQGSILKATLMDRRSPVGFGYDETVPVYFAGSPIFKVGAIDQPAENPEERPSGRGSKKDPDVPQARVFVEEPEKPKPAAGEEGFQIPEDYPYIYQPYIPRIEERPRVILSFAKETEDLLLSGMLEGAEEIAGKPVVIDSPLGKGHLLLFAMNPMWRMNTQGSFMLVFNAILNCKNLKIGWPPSQKKEDVK